MIRNSFWSRFLNTLLEKALRKQAVKDLLRNTCRLSPPQRLKGFFSGGVDPLSKVSAGT